MTASLVAARAAWPDLDVPAATLGAYLSARGLTLHAEHLADLYLACACVERSPAALRAFESTYLAHLPRFLARLHPSAALVDEVKQLLRIKLFTGDAPKIAEYTGKGPLGVWVRVVAVRAAIDLQRTGGRHAPSPIVDLADVASSPELRVLRDLYRPLFKTALASALQMLDKNERTLLRLHFVDGLALEPLARMFNVNKSTISRRVAASMRVLLVEVRARLGEQLGVTTGELNSLATMLLSDLDVSLGDCLM